VTTIKLKSGRKWEVYQCGEWYMQYLGQKSRVQIWKTGRIECSICGELVDDLPELIAHAKTVLGKVG